MSEPAKKASNDTPKTPKHEAKEEEKRSFQIGPGVHQEFTKEEARAAGFYWADDEPTKE